MPTKPTVGLRNNVPLQKGSRENFLPDFFFLSIQSILVLHKEGKKQKREEWVPAYTACLILFKKKRKIRRKAEMSIRLGVRFCRLADRL